MDQWNANKSNQIKSNQIIVSCIICTRFHILHWYSHLICISVPFISLFVSSSLQSQFSTLRLPYFGPLWRMHSEDDVLCTKAWANSSDASAKSSTRQTYSVSRKGEIWVLMTKGTSRENNFNFVKDVNVIVSASYRKNRRHYFVSSGWGPYRGVHMNDPMTCENSSI